MSFVRSEGADGLPGSEPSLSPRTSEIFRRSCSREEPAAAEAQSFLAEDATICETLRRIVSGFSADPTVQQDMLQECLLCLWKAECKTPGRTLSWYLQHCRFHVQHWLAIGRSVDSPKRSSWATRIRIDLQGEDPELENYHTNGEVFDTVCVRDMVIVLGKHLSQREQSVLTGLAQGLVLRDVASSACLSYPTALKYRRRIAALSLKFGIAGQPGRPPMAANGSKPAKPTSKKLRKVGL